MLGSFLAANPATGTVYGGVLSQGHNCTIHAWSWADGSGLRAEGPVPAAGVEVGPRPLAVMPPAPGKRTAHLIVGTRERSELHVLSLPGLALIQTHRLEGVDLAGLAADPWGGALAVCRLGSLNIDVLLWPLPGMPLLD